MAAATAALFFLAASMLFAGAQAETPASPVGHGRLNIVAAENFYGDIASQLAGPHAGVKSMLSDPNVDPHEYEATVNDAISVAAADLAIENGGGYDYWMDKLLSASPNAHRLVVKAYDISPVKLPDNEHVWYNVDDVKVVATALAADLKKLDPAHAADFEQNLQMFVRNLEQIRAKIGEISSRFAGTPVALTEPIFQYQSVPMGLKVLTPFEFEKAVAQAHDPPADAVLTAENQIKNKQVRVLIYNEQTVDRVTAKLQKLAKASGIPVVAVTETMPPATHYQSWMLDQIAALERALSGSGGGRRGAVR